MPDPAFGQIGDLVQVVKDKIAGSKPADAIYIGLENMEAGGSRLLSVESAADSTSTNSVFRKGDILFGKLRPQLRKCIHADRDGYCSTDILVLRAQPGVNAVFAFKAASFEGVFAHAIRYEEGTKMPRTSWAVLRKAPVLNITVGQQRRIAEILTTVDNQIEKTEALIAKYQSIKQGLMHDLFTRGVDEHGRLRPTRDEAPQLYKESELGWIPKEWNARRLGEVLKEGGGFLQTGPFGSSLHAHEYVDDGIPVIMPQDINDGRVETTQIARILEKKAQSLFRHRVRPNDVIFSRRGDLSRAAALSERERGWLCGTGCFLLRASAEKLYPEWLAAMYRYHFVQRQVDANAVGSTMPSLNNAVMEKLRFPFPRVEEQAEMMRHLNAEDGFARAESSRLAKLRLVKLGLMQDLLTGRVPVKLKPNDQDHGDTPKGEVRAGVKSRAEGVHA